MPERYPPREGDIDYNELANRAVPIMKQGGLVYLKWTCPDCGERAMSDNPLEFLVGTGQVIYAPGYVHTQREDGSPCDRLIRTHEHVFGMQIHYITALRRVPLL